MEIGVYRKLVETEEDRLGIDYREDSGTQVYIKVDRKIYRHTITCYYRFYA